MLCFTNIVLMLLFFRSDKRIIPFPIEKQSVMSWSYYMNFKNIYSINVIFIIVFAVDVCVCVILWSLHHWSSLWINLIYTMEWYSCLFLLIVHCSVHVHFNNTWDCNHTYLINFNFFFTKFTMWKKSESGAVLCKCKVPTILCR